jgi:hypothetical protein
MKHESQPSRLAGALYRYTPGKAVEKIATLMMEGEVVAIRLN